MPGMPAFPWWGWAAALPMKPSFPCFSTAWRQPWWSPARSTMPWRRRGLCWWARRAALCACSSPGGAWHSHEIGHRGSDDRRHGRPTGPRVGRHPEDRGDGPPDQGCAGRALPHGRNGGGPGFSLGAVPVPGGRCCQLLEPVGSEGFLQDFLRDRGEGLHHVTLRVRDIEARTRELENLGWRPVKPNFDNPTWKEVFLHPRETHGVLIQLAESDLPYSRENEYYQQLDLEELMASS